MRQITPVPAVLRLQTDMIILLTPTLRGLQRQRTAVMTATAAHAARLTQALQAEPTAEQAAHSDYDTKKLIGNGQLFYQSVEI